MLKNKINKLTILLMINERIRLCILVHHTKSYAFPHPPYHYLADLLLVLVTLLFLFEEARLIHLNYHQWFLGGLEILKTFPPVE